MKRQCSTLLIAGLLGGCGDSVPADTTQLCVQTDRPNTRVWAGYDPETDAGLEPIDDVPVEGGQGCLTLRPPTAPRLNRVELREVRGYRARVQPINLAVYEDLDGDARLTPADRVVEARLQNQAFEGALPYWLESPNLILSINSSQFSDGRVDRKLAPGNRPFALLAQSIDDLGQQSSPFLQPWTELGLDPAQFSPCKAAVFPRCLSPDLLFDDFSLVAFFDPRIPDARRRTPATGPFDPSQVDGAGFDLSTVSVDECQSFESFLVGATRALRAEIQDPPCGCGLVQLTVTVVALNDDPPEWLRCKSITRVKTPSSQLYRLWQLNAPEPPPTLE